MDIGTQYNKPLNKEHSSRSHLKSPKRGQTLYKGQSSIIYIGPKVSFVWMFYYINHWHKWLTFITVSLPVIPLLSIPSPLPPSSALYLYLNDLIEVRFEEETNTTFPPSPPSPPLGPPFRTYLSLCTQIWYFSFSYWSPPITVFILYIALKGWNGFCIHNIINFTKPCALFCMLL